MINYRIVARKNPQTKAVRYYAMATGQKPLSEDDLLEQISEESTVTSADAKAVFDRIVRQIKLNLQNGRTVKLADLGTFMVSIRGKGSTSKEQYSTDLIKNVQIKFVRSAKLRSLFKIGTPNIKFTNIEAKESATTDTPAA